LTSYKEVVRVANPRNRFKVTVFRFQG